MTEQPYTYRSEADRLVEQFYLWELPGRGLQIWGLPVHPEPLFEPFRGHRPVPLPVPEVEIPPPILIGWLNKISDSLFGEPKPPPLPPAPEPQFSLPDPSFFNFEQYRSDVELEITLPPTQHVSRDIAEQLLLSVSSCTHSLSFEVIGLSDAIRIQFAAAAHDADHVEQQLLTHFPGVVITRHERLFADVLLDGSEQPRGAWYDFRLANEFMRPLAAARNFNADPLIGITGALVGLREGEVGILQVIFQPAKHPWAESMLRAVTWEDGSPFLDARLVAQTREKTSRPLFATAIRVLARSDQPQRAESIARGLSAALSSLSEPSANQLVPLEHLELEFHEVCLDTINRRIRHSGMILNSAELVSLVHVPSPSVQTPKLRRETRKTKAAPAIACGHDLVLGTNEHNTQRRSVTLSNDQRVRHMHVIGASGTGKSTLLLNLILQDIERGEGIALLDPHGDLVDAVLARIPPSRIHDVVLIDPADAEYSVGFNILSAHSELEKNLLASDLVSVFQRLSTSWGDQMNSVFATAILAFLESSRGGTIADLRRFLVEKEYRAEFLTTVTDPHVLYYWTKEFPLLKGNPQAPLLTRLDIFLRPKPIRYMVSQQVNRLDFAEIMDGGKIFLAKLAEGAIGEENAYLLGTLLVSKFHQLAIARQQVAESERQYFWCYIDECFHFVTPSMASILTGARKFRLGLVLAHQELGQLERCSDVATAIMANPYTRVCFRLGDDDARRLAEGFSFFDPKDLQNLGIGEAVARIERSDFDFNLSVPLPTEPGATRAAQCRQEVITVSREKYGTRRADIEAVLRSQTEHQTSPPPAPPEPVQPCSRPPPPPPVPIIHEPKPTPKHLNVLKPPPDLGKGGAQHQAIQQRLKAVAEGFNYRVTIEKPVLGNAGSVDLAIESASRSIACEISVTTTTDHEVGNVRKCLKAGFTHVAVVCTTGDRLRKIQDAVEGCLAPAESQNVGYYSPEEFIAHLQELALQDAKSTAGPELRRGYQVKRSIAQLTPEQAKAREEAMLKTLAETVKNKGRAR